MEHKKFDHSNEKTKSLITSDAKAVEWSERGNKLLKQKKWEKATGTYRRALTFDTKHLDALDGLGRVLYYTKHFKEAEQVCIYAIKLHNNEPSLLVTLGLVFNETKRYREAEEIFCDAIGLDENNSRPWGGLGSVFYNTKRFYESENAFRRAISIDDNEFHHWMGISCVFLDQYRNNEAEQALLKAVDLKSDDPYTWNNFGSIYSRKGHYQESEEAYRRAIKLGDENFYEPWYNLGILFDKTHCYKESVKAYLKALEINKKYVEAWQNLGNVYRRNGQLQAAENAYLQAITFDQNFDYPWNGLGNLYHQVGRIDEAEVAYKKSITLNGNSPTPWEGLGNLYLNQFQFKQAYAAYQRSYLLGYLDEATSSLLYKYIGTLLESFCSLLLVRRVMVENPFLLRLPYLQLKYRQAIKPFENAIQFLELIKNENELNPQLDTLRVEGLLTFYLGDSIKASDIFDIIDDREDNDLFDHYYLAVTLEGFFDDNSAVLKEATDIADKYLQDVRLHEPTQLYYAGLIFLLIENEEKAAQSFELAIQQDGSFLPSYYGAILAYDQLLQEGLVVQKKKYEQRTDEIIIEILKKEQAHPEHGYLTYMEIGEVYLEPNNSFKPIIKYAHAMELASAVTILYEWEEQFGADHPKHSLVLHVPERHSINQGDLLKGWVFTEKMEHQFSCLKKVQHDKEIEFLKKDLQAVFHGDFLDLEKKEQNELYSYLISFFEKQDRVENLEKYFSQLIRYFVLKNKINSQQAFLLIAYYLYKYQAKKQKNIEGMDVAHALCTHSVTIIPTALLSTTAPEIAGAVAVCTTFDIVLRFTKNKIKHLKAGEKILSFKEFNDNFSDNIRDLETNIEQEILKAEKKTENNDSINSHTNN